MTRWSKHEAMIMMNFLIDEAENFKPNLKESESYNVRTIVQKKFSRHLIQDRSVDDLMDKAEYLLNEEIHHFATFPLEDRVLCLRVFGVYLSQTMQEEVISSNLFHHVRVNESSLSLKLELEDKRSLRFFTRADHDMPPNENLETVWADEDEEDAVPRHGHVAGDDPEEPPSRAESPQEEDRDELIEHAEHEVLNLPARELEIDEEPASSTTTNAQFIDETADQVETETTASTSREETDSDDVENSAAPQNGINEADERVDVRGVTIDNHNLDDVPIQDVMNHENSRAESPQEENQDDSMEHAERDALDFDAPAFEDDDDHAPLTPPQASFIHEAADQWEPEATASTTGEVTDSDELENLGAPQNDMNEPDSRILVRGAEDGEIKADFSHNNGSPTEVIVPISPEAEQDIQNYVLTVDNEPSSSRVSPGAQNPSLRGISLQSWISRENNACHDNNQPSSSESALPMSNTHLYHAKTIDLRGKARRRIPYVPKKARQLQGAEHLIEFAMKNGGSAEQLADKYIKEQNFQQEDRLSLIKKFRSIYQESFYSDRNRTELRNSMNGQPPITFNVQRPSTTSARQVTVQVPKLAKTSNRVRRRAEDQKTRVLSETTKIADFIISEYRKRPEAYDLKHLTKRYVVQSATSGRAEEIFAQMKDYFPFQFSRDMRDEEKILENIGNPMGSYHRKFLLRSSIFQLDEREHLTFYLSIGRTFGKMDRTKPVEMKMTEYVVLVFLKELSRQYKYRWTDDRIMNEFMNWRGSKTTQDVLDFMRCLGAAKATIAYRKDLTTRDKLNLIAFTDAPSFPDFDEWCSRNFYSDQEAVENTSGHSPLGPQQVEEQRENVVEKERDPELEYDDEVVAPLIQQTEPLSIATTDATTNDMVSQALPTVLSEITTIADFIISEYRRKSEKFDLEKLASVYIAHFSRPYKTREVHHQLSKYFSDDFFVKMRDEAFVLQNRKNPMDYFLEVLYRSSIFQLDNMNHHLTYYSSIGRTFGKRNEWRPVQMDVSEYIVTVFLMELTRRTGETWSDHEILGEFQKWRQRPGSQNDIRDFMYYLQKIKSTVKHRRDLTTRDKQDLLQLFGAQIPADFIKWCNSFYALNQHTTVSTSKPSFAGTQQRIGAQSNLQNLENSSIQADSMDATSSKERSPEEDQRGNCGEGEEDPDLEYHDEVIGTPLVQQEEPSNFAPADVPTEVIAPQSLLAVEINEEEEAPIQRLVEDIEERLRNDNPPPSIEQEPEVTQSNLVNVEHGNFGEKGREPEVEHHDEVVAPVVQLEEPINIAPADVPTKDVAPQNLPAVEIMEEREAQLVEGVEEGPRNDDPPPNIDAEIRRPRLMEFASKNKGKSKELAEQFIKENNRPESEREYLIEQFRKIKKESRKFNRARPPTRNEVQMDPVVLEDLPKNVEDVHEDRRNQSNHVTNMANFILHGHRKAFNLEKFSETYKRMKTRIKSRRDLWTFDEIHMQFLAQTPVTMGFRQWLKENCGVLEGDDQGCITSDNFPREILMKLQQLESEPEQSAVSPQTPPTPTSEQHEMTNGSEQVMNVGWIPSPSEVGNDKDPIDEFEENQAYLIHHDVQNETMDYSNGDDHTEANGISQPTATPVDDPNKVPTSNHRSISPVQDVSVEFENGGSPTETPPPLVAPIEIPIQAEKELKRRHSVDHRSNMVVEDEDVEEVPKKKKRNRNNVEVDRASTSVTLYPTDASGLTECSSKCPESFAQKILPSTVQQMTKKDLIPSTPSEVPTSASSRSNPPVIVQDETIEIVNGGPAIETPTPLVAPIEIPIQAKKELKATHPANNESNGVVVEDSGSKTYETESTSNVSETAKKKKKCRKDVHVENYSTAVTVQSTDASTLTNFSGRPESSANNIPLSTVKQLTKNDHILSTSSEVPEPFSHHSTPPVIVQDETIEFENKSPSTETSTPSAAPIGVGKYLKCRTHTEAEESNRSKPAGEGSNSGSGSKIDSKQPEKLKKKNRSRKTLHVDPSSTSVAVSPTNTATLTECGDIPNPSAGSVIPAAPFQKLANDEQSTSSEIPASSGNDTRLPIIQSTSSKDWEVKQLRKLTLYLKQEKRKKWEKIITKSGKQLDEAQLKKLLSEAQKALSRNFEKFTQSKLAKLKLLVRLRVPIRDNIKNEISKDTVYQLDQEDCITFFCYQAVRVGKRDQKAPDNLSQLHRELLNAMVCLSQEKIDGEKFLSNDIILNSLGMDKRHGRTDKDLLEEIEKAKNYFASDDRTNFSQRLGVLKATRTAVTELLLSQASHNYEVKKDKNNRIMAYWKKDLQTEKSLESTAGPVVQQSAVKEKNHDEGEEKSDSSKEMKTTSFDSIKGTGSSDAKELERAKSSNDESNSTKVAKVQKCSAANLLTPESTAAEEVADSSTGVCNAVASTSKMTEAPVPSPVQHSSTTAEETRIAETTMPVDLTTTKSLEIPEVTEKRTNYSGVAETPKVSVVASPTSGLNGSASEVVYKQIPVEKVSATVEPSMSSKKAMSPKRTESSIGPVGQRSDVKRKNHDKEKAKPDSFKRMKTTSSDGKEPEHFKSSNEESNSTKVTTGHNCSAVNLSTPESKGAKEVADSSTGVCNAEASTSRMTEAPVHSPLQHSSITAEETRISETTMPVKYTTTMSSEIPEVMEEKIGVAEKPEVVQESIVKRKNDGTKKEESAVFERMKAVLSDAKKSELSLQPCSTNDFENTRAEEARRTGTTIPVALTNSKSSKANEKGTNSPALLLIPEVSAVVPPTPKLNGTASSIVEDLEPLRALKKEKSSSANDGETPVEVPSKKRQASVEEQANTKRAKTGENPRCQIDQGETSTSSTVTPNAETSNPIPDVQNNISVAMEFSHAEGDAPSSSEVTQKMSPLERVDVSSKIGADGQVSSAEPTAQASNSGSHANDIPKEATSAATNNIELSKASSDQIQFNDELIEASQVHLSILTGLEELREDYPMFGQELDFKKKNVEKIELKIVINLFNQCLRTINFYIRQSIEEREPEGVQVGHVFRMFGYILPTLKKYEESHQEVKNVLKEAKAVRQQLKKDDVADNKMLTDALILLLEAWIDNLKFKN